MSCAPSRRAWVTAAADHVAGLAEHLLGLGRVHPASGLDHGRAAERALLAVDGDHHHDHALLGQLLAVPQHPVLDVPHRPVHVDVAGGHPAVARDPLGVELNHVAVLAEEDLGRVEAHGQGETGMVHHVAVLPVHRHEALGPGDVHQRPQLPLAGVPAHVDRLGPRVHDLGTSAVQVVDDLAHRPLVARDGMGADDHDVVLTDAQPLVLPRGHQRQCRHRLALGAGRDHAHLARREVVDVLDVHLHAVGDR